MHPALSLSRDALPGGPDEVPFTDEAVAHNALEKLVLRLDGLSQRNYPRCYVAAVMRQIARLNLAISEVEQMAGGYRS